jgi:hypothetical protein
MWVQSQLLLLCSPSLRVNTIRVCEQASMSSPACKWIGTSARRLASAGTTFAWDTGRQLGALRHSGLSSHGRGYSPAFFFGAACSLAGGAAVVHMRACQGFAYCGLLGALPAGGCDCSMFAVLCVGLLLRFPSPAVMCAATCSAVCASPDPTVGCINTPGATFSSKRAL